MNTRPKRALQVTTLSKVRIFSGVSHYISENRIQKYLFHNFLYLILPEGYLGPLQTSNSNTLRDLVSFVQFKKRGKHPWRCVTFSKVAG